MARKQNDVINSRKKKPVVKRKQGSVEFSKRETEDRDVNYDARSKTNDPAWYAQNAQLMSDVASFSYNYPLGTQMPDDNVFTSRYTGQGSVPGICTIHTTPRIGVTGESNDPINVAQRNIYSFVRHANSGSTNRYEAPDEMLYLIAMDSAFSFIEMLKRAYGTVLTYSQTNRYFPLAAVRAQGFNFVDLQRNLSDFRAYINTLAVKVGSLCIPASMSYMARHQWMYSGMYYDTPSNQKAQVYMYVPEAFYFYTRDASGAGACTLVEFDRNAYASDFCYPGVEGLNDKSLGWTFEEIVAFGNALIDPLLADQDINTMSGDILKAFGANNVYMIQTIPENYTVLPVYSPEVLSQIHNTTLFGRSINPESIEDFSGSGQLNPVNINNSIIQSADKTYLQNIPYAYFMPSPVKPGEFIWSDGEFQDSTFGIWYNQMANVKRILDFETGPVSPADAMVATRLMNHAAYFNKTFSDNVASQTAVRRHGCDEGDELFRVIGRYNTAGSETAGYMKLWYWAKVGYSEDNTWALIHTEDIYSTMWNAAPNYRNDITKSMLDDGLVNWAESIIFSGQRKGLLSSFNMHPAVSDNYLWRVKEADQDLLISKGETWPQFDINYYTVLDREDLRQLNETALLSEFNVTQYGRRA